MVCNASNRCVEYMSCSLNRPIKTQVSPGSEPPYTSNRHSRPADCVDAQPRKRPNTLVDDAACISPAPTNARRVRAAASRSGGNACLPRHPCFQARGARGDATDGRDGTARCREDQSRWRRQRRRRTLPVSGQSGSRSRPSVAPAATDRGGGGEAAFTPGAAARVSTPSWPLWCLQLPNVQLARRATIGPIRLRRGACALVASWGTRPASGISPASVGPGYAQPAVPNVAWRAWFAPIGGDWSERPS